MTLTTRDLCRNMNTALYALNNDWMKYMPTWVAGWKPDANGNKRLLPGDIVMLLCHYLYKLYDFSIPQGICTFCGMSAEPKQWSLRYTSTPCDVCHEHRKEALRLAPVLVSRKLTTCRTCALERRDRTRTTLCIYHDHPDHSHRRKKVIKKMRRAFHYLARFTHMSPTVPLGGQNPGSYVDLTLDCE